jgi:L-threonylcarbamoyladenylate synthase
MQTIKLCASNLINASRKASSILKEKGCIVYPTDTIYGLGANAVDAEAVRKTYRIKQRNDEQPISIAVSGMEMADKYAIFSGWRLRLVEQLLPGPYTIVLSKRSGLPDELSNNGTIGLRWVRSDLLDTLFGMIDFPITATSANISGLESSSDVSEIIRQFSASQFQPDMILNAGRIISSGPSTVIDASGDKPRVIRIGSAKANEIINILESII